MTRDFVLAEKDLERAREVSNGDTDAIQVIDRELRHLKQMLSKSIDSSTSHQGDHIKEKIYQDSL